MIPETHSKRGQLIQFKAYLGDRCLADWRVIQHTPTSGHTVGRPEFGAHEFNAGAGAHDSIKAIRHGILIERVLQETS